MATMDPNEYLPGPSPRVLIRAYSQYSDQIISELRVSAMEFGLSEEISISIVGEYNVEIQRGDPTILEISVVLEWMRNVSAAISILKFIHTIVKKLEERRQHRQIHGFSINQTSRYLMAQELLRNKGVDSSQVVYFKSFSWESVSIYKDAKAPRLHVLIVNNMGELSDYAQIPV